MRRMVVTDTAAIAGLGRPDTPEARKARGAFFTPQAIADFLARWAIRTPKARVLDPTSGDGAFLVAAGRVLQGLGASPATLDEQVIGLDIHEPSLQGAGAALMESGLDAQLIHDDFLRQEPPGGLFTHWQPVDAVVGNPPFIRYQQHVGDARVRSLEAALRQGVRLSGLASSWAALLVHAGAFLAPEGRLAMVLPAELLSVGYAEPVRQWLRRRFSTVSLVVFERLQFSDALENVVLLLAQGSGGCDAFNLFYVEDAAELARTNTGFDGAAVALGDEGKWTEMFLSTRARGLFRQVSKEHFVPLGDYGPPELGTVTGANSYFAIDEQTRSEYDLHEDIDVVKISPPGTRHLKGLGFSLRDWSTLQAAGDKVWLFCPSAKDTSPGIERYKALGAARDVPSAYKCQIRTEWWRPPVVTPPDLFFTYMSHRFPRLVSNRAGVTFLNSMHGVRLRAGTVPAAREALPLLGLNSVTMLGGEIHGRSYGGGVLKMEPREARILPVPSPVHLDAAWVTLKAERDRLDRQLREGRWTSVLARVDEVLLRDTMKLPDDDRRLLFEAAQVLRQRRLARARGSGEDG
ncbi:N-6 DNA methylase [soil metagenome]